MNDASDEPIIDDFASEESEEQLLDDYGDGQGNIEDNYEFRPQGRR